LVEILSSEKERLQRILQKILQNRNISPSYGGYWECKRQNIKKQVVDCFFSFCYNIFIVEKSSVWEMEDQ